MMGCCGNTAPMQTGHGFAMGGGGVQRIAWAIYDPLTESYLIDEDGNRIQFASDNEAYRSGLGEVQAVWVP